MVYALNIKKGTTIRHPSIGELKGGVAVEILEKDSVIAKHLINVVVFDEVIRKKDSFKKKEISVEKENGSNAGAT